MKLQKKYFICIVFCTITCSQIDKKSLPKTIYGPYPLTKIHSPYQQKIFYNNLCAIKYYSPVYTAILLTQIKKTSLYDDIYNNPFTTIAAGYGIVTTYYALSLLKKNRDFYLSIKTNLQHIFTILIIGYGIYNEINHNYYFAIPSKFSLQELQKFLEQGYESWFALSNFYHQHYKNEPLFMYHINNIDFIDVVQASQNEIEILPQIIHFYHEPYDIYNMEIIINYLRTELKNINRNIYNLNDDL